jgi:drug/metabolite transporter (DMT)-like permease
METAQIPPRQTPNRAKGYAYGISAVMVVSPDAMLCRLPDKDEDVLMVTAWRCAWVMLFCVATCTLKARGVRALICLIRAHVRPLLLVGATSSMTSIGFPLSLQLTGSAEALLLISLSPLWGAVIGWRCLGDALPLRTKLAVLGALLSICIIFLPVVVSGADSGEQPSRPNRLLGDIIALFTGLGLGGYSNAVRFVSSRHPRLPTQVAQIISNFNAVVICAALALVARRPFAVRRPEQLWWVTMLMGFIVNLAYLGFNVAPKYITAAEFGIIALLEAILGPVWVYLLVGEEPSAYTLAGGALLISTMVAHEAAASKAAKNEAPNEMATSMQPQQLADVQLDVADGVRSAGAEVAKAPVAFEVTGV